MEPKVDNKDFAQLFPKVDNKDFAQLFPKVDNKDFAQLFPKVDNKDFAQLFPKVDDKVGVQYIHQVYDHLSYFDLYGNSVILFILITLSVFAVFSYCKVMQTKEEISADWSNQRCKPQNMLFAGMISKEEGTSVFQSTSNNFQYCVQHIMTSFTQRALDPFQYLVGSLTSIFSAMASAIQATRGAISNIRQSIQQVTEDILGRILTVLIPLQKMFIALMDTFQKIQGTMVAGLYTMLGTYYTLQSLMGAILEMIIKILMSLVIIIVGLWIVPFTWPAAAAMTSVFLSIATPLAVIVYFMTEVLHIKTSGIPKLRCFDGNTVIPLFIETPEKIVTSSEMCKTPEKIVTSSENIVTSEKRKKEKGIKRTVKIKDLKVGDRLANGSTVTATMVVTSQDMPMYHFYGLTVSGSHLVQHSATKEWMRVSQHPDAVLLSGEYEPPYLYCFNTSNQVIQLNGQVFSDWDEDIILPTAQLREEKKQERTRQDQWDIEQGIALKVGNKDFAQLFLKVDKFVYGLVDMGNGYTHFLTTGGKWDYHRD